MTDEELRQLRRWAEVFIKLGDSGNAAFGALTLKAVEELERQKRYREKLAERAGL